MHIEAPTLYFSAPSVAPPIPSNNGFVIAIILLSFCIFGYFVFSYIFPKPTLPKTFDEQNNLQLYLF